MLSGFLIKNESFRTVTDLARNALPILPLLSITLITIRSGKITTHIQRNIPL